MHSLLMSIDMNWLIYLSNGNSSLIRHCLSLLLPEVVLIKFLFMYHSLKSMFFKRILFFYSLVSWCAYILLASNNPNPNSLLKSDFSCGHCNSAKSLNSNEYLVTFCFCFDHLIIKLSNHILEIPAIITGIYRYHW